MSLLKLVSPLPGRPRPTQIPGEPAEFSAFLARITDEFAELQGRRRLISLPPKEIATTRAKLRQTIAAARRQDAPRLGGAAQELDTALAEIEAEARGYSQRFELRRLFEGFLEEARRALAEIQAGEHGQSARKPGARPKVLIVDDDFQIHRLIERVIGRDADVLTALDCGEALEVLDGARPDLILLDVHLPDMKGTEFLHELKAHPAHATIPVVMLSNSYDDSTVVSGLVGGAIDYLSKDLKLPSLRPRILEVLEHGRARLTGSA